MSEIACICVYCNVQFRLAIWQQGSLSERFAICPRLGCWCLSVCANYVNSFDCIAFIHFYSASHSMSLSVALPTTAIDTVSEFIRRRVQRYKQLQVKDLPKVPTWRLERDSNPRRSSRKASTLPMRHHAPQRLVCIRPNRGYADSKMIWWKCF